MVPFLKACLRAKVDLALGASENGGGNSILVGVDAALLAFRLVRGGDRLHRSLSPRFLIATLAGAVFHPLNQIPRGQRLCVMGKLSSLSTALRTTHTALGRISTAYRVKRTCTVSASRTGTPATYG
eukprot:7163246-Prymnesium_polylepis.1